MHDCIFQILSFTSFCVFACMCVLSCSFVSRDGTLVSCFSCIGRQILYHWATCKAIWYTYSISYAERSVYPTVVSLSSPALPLAVQLRMHLHSQDRPVSLSSVSDWFWRIFALHLRQGPGTSPGSLSALALHLAFHMVPLSIQWRSMGKNWWVRKTYSMDEVAGISD